MKARQLFMFIVVFVLSFAYYACSSSPIQKNTTSTIPETTSDTDGLSLMEAIEQSADRIANELPPGSRIAILAFETDSPQLSIFIMEELAGALFDRKIEIADRQNLDIVYRELTFQTSGDVSDTTVQSLGKFLGAEMVITGQMRPLGTTYRFTANAIHVEKATRASIPRLTVRNDREIQNMITALNQQTGSSETTMNSQSERTIAEARVKEVRAIAERIATESSTTLEAQAVAEIVAEALTAAESRAEKARAAEAFIAEEERKAAAAAAVARIPIPTGLSAEVGYTSIQLSWNVVPGDVSYSIYRSATEFGAYTQIANLNNVSYTDNNLNQNTTYHYKVSTVLDDIEGRQSLTVSAKTLSLTVGTIVPGDSLVEKLAWLQRSADSHNTYIIELNADETVSPITFEYRGAINITIVLRGDNQNRTLRLRSHGSMFIINTDVTFILENNITLHGHNGNEGAIVRLEGGTFKMYAGSSIIGNIRGNNTGGGGVRLNSGIFEMAGGIISGNTATSGGGVYAHADINKSCTFTMSGGIISGNAASSEGGGVYVGRYLSGTCPFTLTGGTISDNKASRGGGVHIDRSTFNMQGGNITNNIATSAAGGVSITASLGISATFTKTGGIITGYNTDQINGNVVRDGSGNVLARRGHAIAGDAGNDNINPRKETSAGLMENLSFDYRGANGVWDQ